MLKWHAYLVCFCIIEDVHGSVHPGGSHLLQLSQTQQSRCIACMAHQLSLLDCHEGVTEKFVSFVGPVLKPDQVGLNVVHSGAAGLPVSLNKTIATLRQVMRWSLILTLHNIEQTVPLATNSSSKAMLLSSICGEQGLLTGGCMGIM